MLVFRFRVFRLSGSQALGCLGFFSLLGLWFLQLRLFVVRGCQDLGMEFRVVGDFRVQGVWGFGLLGLRVFRVFRLQDF